MNFTKITVNLLTVCIVFLISTTIAQAQASRTWVSGVGDDANPCSRTAPCKTFAGAISKTAARGEINVLDPGGYGAVTITKAITIDGGGSFASILAAGSNGIIVNAGVSDVVILRNLSINGFGTGLNGIRFLAGRTLQVENVQIHGFTTHGIDVVHSSTTTPGALNVINSTFSMINSVAVRVDNAGGAVAPSANLSNVKIDRVSIGFDVLKSATATISNSVLSHVTNQAIVAENSSVINVSNVVAFKNGTGVAAFTAGATIRLSNSDIFNNTTGVSVAAGGICDRFQNNRIFGNITDFSPGIGSCTARTDQ
jgi:hypothetical protein